MVRLEALDDVPPQLFFAVTVHWYDPAGDAPV